MYSIRSVINNLEELNDKKESLPKPSTVESALESVRNAIRQSKYREAIDPALAITLDNLNLDQLQVVSSLLHAAALGVGDEPAVKVSAFDRAIDVGNRIEGKAGLDVASPSQLAQSLVSKGITLGDFGRTDDAIATYDDLIRRFGDAPEPALREIAIEALV